jgi:phospho-N-acetylmuramoyl-pentapeptide-transferase
MQIKILLVSLFFFALAICSQRAWIAWMRRLKMGQNIKKYGPDAHMKKSGTPTMGGVVALLLIPVSVCFVHLTGISKSQDMVSVWSYPFLAALVGLTDDILKHRSGSSEGLRSVQKLVLQVLVTVPWAIWSAKDGLYLLPSMAAASPLISVFSLVFLGVGIQNAVNVTDGLDGLAGGAVALSLAAVLLWSDTDYVTVSASVGLALIAAFLWHNSNPADIFMGDVGSHLWAGLLISLCVEAKSLLLLFPICFIFGVEIVSVAIQIVSIRKFGKKIFLMSPLHHHFELMGWKETRIVARFCLIHLIGMAALFVFVFALYGGAPANVSQ